MPRYNNYSLVADTSFNPYQSMQEMLVPFAAYKDAYEKQEALLDEINQNTDTFKYLEQVAKDNPESEAARIYNNYADELKRQAADFSANGLTMANRRSLSNLKRRYQGEIGLLDTASKAMEEERKLRRQLGAKDHSMLYATDNLNIDDFLYGKNPNLYSVSGNELYTKGAALGKAASSRVYKAGDEGSVLGGYYRNWKEARGVSQESIADFMNSDAVQQEVDNMLRAEGVTGNLTGANYERARQQVLNGIYTGIVYEESNKPVRDAGVMSAAERDSSARGWANHNESVRMHNLQLKMAGYDENGVYHPENDQTLKKAEAVAKAKGVGSKGSGSSTIKDTQTNGRVRFTWNGNNPNDTNGEADEDYNVEAVASDDTGHPGVLYSYDRLPTYVKKAIAPLVGDGKQHLYDYYFKSYEGGLFNDSEASIELVPRKVITQNRSQRSSDSVSDDSGLNDIPE